MPPDIGKGITNVGSIRWEGLDEVLKNLNKEIAKISNKTADGLLQAALLVQRESQRRVPVDTGNLKGSAYIIYGGGNVQPTVQSQPSFVGKQAGKVSAEHSAHISERKGAQKTFGFLGVEPFAEIGFTAFYALYVHENLKASHVKANIIGKVTKKKKEYGIVGGFVQIGQAKYLEHALMENSQRIINIIKSRAKVD